jgi:hypothetical protein
VVIDFEAPRAGLFGLSWPYAQSLECWSVIDLVKGLNVRCTLWNFQIGEP